MGYWEIIITHHVNKRLTREIFIDLATKAVKCEGNDFLYIACLDNSVNPQR